MRASFSLLSSGKISVSWSVVRSTVSRLVGAMPEEEEEMVGYDGDKKWHSRKRKTRRENVGTLG